MMSNIESQSNDIKQILRSLPESPGVYQFFNIKEEVIYVGKAKNLKSRVSSYFKKTNYESFKLKVLAGKVNNITYIVVDSEADALLLENNLIKKLQPRYNVLLKDDKTFPWICIKNENFPRIFLTRKRISDGSKYYGPYTSAATARSLIRILQQIYKLRTCNYDLSETNINEKKYRVCLEYHIENCLGPCEGYQDDKDYNESVRQIHEILKGNLTGVIGFLEEEMKKKSALYHFEEAESLKQKFNQLKQFQTKSTIVNASINNVDVYTIIDEDKYAIVNYLKIAKGAVVQVHNVEIQKRLNESTRQILEFAIADLSERTLSKAKELILPFDMSEELPWFKITVPKIGDKKKLLDLSFRNAKIYGAEKHKRKENAKRVYYESSVLKKLKEDLRLKKLPVHIECFDNSNIQGENPVAACVVFKNGKPAKREYRYYNIKTVVGPDDFASMEEVVYRRYRRLIEEKQELPQLIIIDGGKGQLNAALKSLDKLDLRNVISIIGIAKKLEEVYFPNDPIPLYIDKNSAALRLIQHARNEAHRFGIEFHRLKRSTNQIHSKLESIPGVGKKTIEKLYKRFQSYNHLKAASLEEIIKVVGPSKAKKLKAYLSELE
ncbi:MAG TPA: excinuclease ABC subunit UvrC [Bacteroidales bacterium]|nr:excinuclease ABC subunit UvrC [Bacteroidales bacterium]